MATAEDILKQAAGLKQSFDRNCAAIATQGLQPDVEKMRVADLYLRARDELAELRKAYDSARTRERIDYAQQAFGVADLMPAGADPMTQMVSYRDAQDRAEAVGNRGQLSSLLARAFGSADPVLARACAVHAFRNGWNEIVQEYDDQVPGWSDLAQQAREQERNESLAGAVRFGLRRPSVLAGLSVPAIEKLIKRVQGDMDERDKARRPKWTI